MPHYVQIIRRAIAFGLCLILLCQTAGSALAGDRPYFRWLEGSHGEEVTNVAYSPDGTVLASTGDDATVKLWRTSDGQLLRTMPYTRGSRSSLAFSPSGQTIAVAAGAVTLFNMSDGSSSRILPNSILAYFVDFHPDGRHLVLASDDHVLFYDLVTPGIQWSVPCPAVAMDMALSVDGARLAVAFRDKVIRVYRVDDGERLLTLAGGTTPMLSVAYSHDGSLIAGGSEGQERKIRLWRATDGELLRSWYGPGSAVLDLAFSPDDTVLATGMRYGSVAMWDIETWTLRECQGPHGIFDSVSFSPDGTTIAAADSKYHTANIWRVDDGSSVWILGASSNPVAAIAYSPDGRWVASGATDGSIVLRKGNDGAIEREFGTPGTTLNALLFLPDSLRLMSACDNGHVQIWNAEKARVVKDWQVSRQGINSISLSGDGSRLATGADNGVVKLWRMPEGVRIWSGRDNDRVTSVVAVSPDGQWVASGGADGFLRIWRASDGGLYKKITYRLNPIISALTFSSDGRVLAMGNTLGEIYVYAVPEFRFLKYLYGNSVDCVTSLTFNRSATTLVSSNKNAIIHVWDWETGTMLHAFDNETAPFVTSISLSADEQSLAIGRADGTVGVIESPLCAGPDTLLRARCKAMHGGHRDLVVILAGGAPGDTYHAALAGGEQAIATADVRGHVKLRFRAENAPFCGPTRVYVCGFDSPIDCPCD